MISAADREEAVSNGASCQKTCERLGLTERTYYRWKRRKIKTDSYEDGRPNADHSNPRNKLPTEARHQIIEICNQPEYASKAPCEIVPDLADKGTYIASESTFYRVLREEKMQNHRGRAEHASELIQQICLKQGRLTTQPLVLHSDNGSPMKVATMLATLYQLGITPSNSRPRVSNDNPYAESLFKTLKYRPDYQPKGFAMLQEAREWVSLFVQWYNYEHHHSGLKFLTPD